MISLQARVRGMSFIAPGRGLVHEGTLFKMDQQCQVRAAMVFGNIMAAQAKQRMCYLFNDIFMYTRPSDTHTGYRSAHYAGLP